MAANVGGDVLTTYKTFHVSDGQLEEFLRAKLGTYEQRQVIGVEVLEEPKI
jgi:hypothetical protein